MKIILSIFFKKQLTYKNQRRIISPTSKNSITHPAGKELGSMKRKVFTQPGAPNRLMTSVKVGPKGQIVIPKEAREMFGIESGTVLMLLADTERGIAINTMEHFNAVAEEIFSRTTQSKDTVFASMIKKVGDNSDE